MENELKPCPFCGANLERRERTLPGGRKEVAFIHPENRCIILQWKIVDEVDMRKWNRRMNENTDKRL